MRRLASPASLLALWAAGCATSTPTGWRGASAPEARPGDGFTESDLPEAEAGPPPPLPARDDLSVFDLQARIAARARSYLGRRGPFRAKGQRFGSDCSGFVEAVYAAEGLMLRELMQRAAPEERGGVKAAWWAARASGAVFGPGEWPAPGDLVFFDDTYDRNRNGRADDRFTHLGIVEYVDEGTVYFLHRGGKGVARGVLTPGRPYEARDADGRPLNSHLRAITHPVKDGGLAGALLAGYGRIDPRLVPPEYATREIDPFFGDRADRDEARGGGATARAGIAAGDLAPDPTATAKISPSPPRSGGEGRGEGALRAPASTWTATAAANRTVEPVAPSAHDEGGGRSASASGKRTGKIGSRSECDIRRIKSASGSTRCEVVARKKAGPAKKGAPHKAASGKKALARTKPSAKARSVGDAQRVESAAVGGASAPSSATRTAAAPKSSSDSRRTTGMTDPAGSR